MTWLAEAPPVAVILVVGFIAFVVLANLNLYAEPFFSLWFDNKHRSAASAPTTVPETKFTPRVIALQRDFRDAFLPDGMTEEQWVTEVCIPAILELGLGEHEVDLIMPRWMLHKFEHKIWSAPFQTAFCKSKIHALRGTYIYEVDSETSLLQVLRVEIVEKHLTDE